MRIVLSMTLVSLGMLCLGTAISVRASSPLERHDRPNAGDGPTPIQQSVYIVDIIEVNDVERTITLDYVWLQVWSDPRLADDAYESAISKSDLSIDDIWNPHLSRVNLRESAAQEAILKIDGKGNVVYRLRFIDTFTAPLDLKRFPFDRQMLRLQFLSSVYGPDELEIQWNDERSGNLDTFSLPGWSFNGWNREITTLTLKNMDNSMQGFDVQLDLSRRSGFYVWKVFVPLSFIVFMAWTVFCIDPANFSGQIAISTSSVITLIAFQLSLTELLPNISYLTEIDLFVLASSFLVFVALGEAILTARLAKIGKPNQSLAIDKWMRILYPIAFVIILFVVIF